MNDNRNYYYKMDSYSKRKEYQIIAQLIPAGSTAVDLGCGDGTLLSMLKKKNIKGEGIDISNSAIKSAQHKGIKAKTGRIDVPLNYYRNKQFDYAICNVTLQMVMYPEVLLHEMKRIAKYQIVSFPNFAFILNRLDLLVFGRMPQFMMSGYHWFSTGHIHQLSIKDFENFCQDNKFKIKSRYFLFPHLISYIPNKIMDNFANFLATAAIYFLED